jgi:hypothetical protein
MREGSAEGVDDLLHRTKPEKMVVLLFWIKQDLGGIYQKGCRCGERLRATPLRNNILIFLMDIIH